MCETCGCGIVPEHNKKENHISGHVHDNEHEYDHDHEDEPGRIIEVRKDILHDNAFKAERNRGFFEARKIRCYNIVGSPGSGKTALLERTILDRKHSIGISVIEGDQEGSLDAVKLRTAGAETLQVNTGYGCHLDAGMVHHALHHLSLQNENILFIENVGNLVCPTLFDLGEEKRVVVYSVTEGEDKPLKYPYMFRSAQACILTKTDLLPYLNLKLDTYIEHIRRTHPEISIIAVSVRTGEGLDHWYQWLGIL